MSVAATPFFRHAAAEGNSVDPARLSAFFEARCDLDPSRVAIIWEGQSLTYGALETAANRLANHLRQRGIGRGHKVGILLKRSFNTYIALLAVNKAGAAFVPLDPIFPEDRVAFVAKDANLSAILSTSDVAETFPGLAPLFIRLDTEQEALARLSDARPQPGITNSACDLDETMPLSHIIYTSGSTGNPKGVAIGHANICNFIRAVRESWAVAASDRVYQGMTIAFDFAHEEIWPGLDAGATIIAGPTDGRRMGPDLATFLNDHQVTVFSCVPTLLATLDRDVPSIHLLMVGGEHCPAALVEKWARPGRRMLNTYGPTETTCNASSGELLPGKPVTLGKPLPTYSLHVLDENMQPVAEGGIGEIHIGGQGVSLGYINLPDQTAAKFVADPFNRQLPTARLYKTGDLGRLLAANDIEFLGRADSQVKIRGYRIELSEIEAVILENAAIENTIVVAWEATPGEKELVAYVTRHDPNATVTAKELWSALRDRLPPYMVPAHIEFLAAMPRLPNGKVDRKQLPAPSTNRLTHRDRPVVAPEGELETLIASIWQKSLSVADISVEDDFFKDLGGHSLLAAGAVTALRRDPRCAAIGISDIYAAPTIRELAKLIAETRAPLISAETTTASHYAGNAKVFFCGAAQFAALFALSALTLLPIVLALHWVFVAARDHLATGDISFLHGAAFMIGAALLAWFLVPVAGKWLLLGRVKPGQHPVWGSFYFRWWLVKRLVAMSPLALLSGTPFMGGYMSLFGARIGKHSHIGTASIHAFDLLTIGSDVSIEHGTHLANYVIHDGMLRVDHIHVADRCTIGSNSVLMLNSRMEADSRLGDQSLLGEGAVIPAGQAWAGSPARLETLNDPSFAEMAAAAQPVSAMKRIAINTAFTLAVAATVAFPLLAALPSIYMTTVLAVKFGFGVAILAAPLAGLSWVASVAFWIVVAKTLVLRRIAPGLHQTQSLLYVCKWFVDKLMSFSLVAIQSLYSTLYLAPFLRLLGAKVGRFAEVSTVSNITPTLLEIGDGSFIADQASAGATTVHRGVMKLGHTRIGHRAFVGNSAFLPADATLSDGCLLGVMSVPPKATPAPGTSWFGSPAIYLPNRQASESFDDKLTFNPGPVLVAKRLAYEYFRVTLPATLLALGSLGFVYALYHLVAILDVPALLVTMTALAWIAALAISLVVAGLKWSLIGTYRPLVRPLWSSFVWRTELITALYENVTVPALLSSLTGTPAAAWVLRLMGAKIGRRVVMETTFLTEFDLVSVGDDAAVGPQVSLQSHLFEDRVMKMSHVTVGAKASIGLRGVVLYDSVIEESGRLDSLSLLMKGETLPEAARYRGAPSRALGK